jgi:hypothetical protein
MEEYKVVTLSVICKKSDVSTGLSAPATNLLGALTISPQENVPPPFQIHPHIRFEQQPHLNQRRYDHVTPEERIDFGCR